MDNVWSSIRGLHGTTGKGGDSFRGGTEEDDVGQEQTSEDENRREKRTREDEDIRKKEDEGEREHKDLRQENA